MKTLKQITFAIVTLLFLNSCEKVEELSEVDFDTDINKEITFTLDSNDDFSQTLNINLADYGDVSDYLNKIESIHINTANYKVTAFPGDLFVSGNVTVNSAGQTFGPYTHTSFAEDFQNQTLYNLEGANKLNVIANVLKDTNQLQITFSGSSDAQEAATITLKVSLNLSITAQAL